MTARRTASLLSFKRANIASQCQKRHFSCTTLLRADFTHAVIGGGVVGLAVARQLSLRPNTSTLLIERHASVGTETSSRNSEVIHAGIYYGGESLKTKLCISGRQLLYDFCTRYGVAHRRTGKWIVAQNDVQAGELDKLHRYCRDEIGVPTRWVSAEEIARDGEGVKADAGALESPTTGIVDVHGLMECLTALLEDNGGVVALNSSVQGIRTTKESSWELDVKDTADAAMSTITAETIVNAAGLGAADVHNMIVPSSAQPAKLYFAKGNYFSYSSSRPRITRLIYPAPEPGASGLGTHLTLDLAGRLRFGPDVEWVDSPDDVSSNGDGLPQALDAIRRYLPGVDETCLAPDYAGIRPKLSYGGAGQSGPNFNDFVVRLEEGYEGWVNLLGIESPGLTSSLAIAKRVEELLYGSVSRG